MGLRPSLGASHHLEVLRTWHRIMASRDLIKSGLCCAAALRASRLTKQCFALSWVSVELDFWWFWLPQLSLSLNLRFLVDFDHNWAWVEFEFEIFADFDNYNWAWPWDLSIDYHNWVWVEFEIEKFDWLTTTMSFSWVWLRFLIELSWFWKSSKQRGDHWIGNSC